MDLDKSLDIVLKQYESGELGDGTVDAIVIIKTIFKDAGYIKLPGNAQNITITTSDNPSDGKLMTEEEWHEKYLEEHSGQNAND